MKQTKTAPGPASGLLKFFSSVKLSIFLLIALAVASAIGTFIPQNENPAAYIQKFGESGYSFLNTFGFVDLYHSKWYQALLILLSLNLIICSIDKLSSIWKIVFPNETKIKPALFQNAAFSDEFKSKSSKDNLVKHISEDFKKKFSIFLSKETESGILLYGEKGRWTRLGVYAVHLSVLLMLLGGLVGSFFGFEGYIDIPEGETGNEVILKNKEMMVKLNFDIRCDDFNVTYYDTGAPSEYRSKLTILENGAEVMKKDIVVNDPLRYKGINIFQSNYGTVAPKEVDISILSRDSKMSYTKKMKIGDTVEIPEGLGKFTLQDFSGSFEFRGHNLGETFFGEFVDNGGEKEMIMIPTRFKRFDQMRGGKAVFSVDDFTRSFYTGLQITRDPGVPLVYAGFIMMIIGCYITFFMYHEKALIEIRDTDKGAVVIFHGTANKNKFSAQLKMSRMFEKIKKTSG